VGHTVAEVGTVDGVASETTVAVGVSGNGVSVAMAAGAVAVAVGGRDVDVSVGVAALMVAVAVGGRDVRVCVAVAAAMVAVAAGGSSVGVSVMVAALMVAVAVGGRDVGVSAAVAVGMVAVAGEGDRAPVGGGAVAVASRVLRLASGKPDSAHQPRAPTSRKIPVSPATVDRRQRGRLGSNGTRSTVPPHAGWMGS